MMYILSVKRLATLIFLLILPCISYGASLTGNIVTAPSTVNLTTEGTADWVHWGLNSATDLNRKSGVTPQISNITTLGAAPKQWTGAKTIWPSLTWSDGTPTPGATGTSTLLYVQGNGGGYQFTAPADTTTRALRIYLGAYKARGQLQVALSDNSAAPYVTTIETVTGEIARLVTLTFSAASNNQTLTVTYTLQASYGTTTTSPGDIDLQAATLQVYATGGSLSGAIDIAPLTVDLTTEGTSDWAHWGLNSATDMNRKSGVSPQISNIAALKTAPKRWTGAKTIWPSLTWSDGTPTTSATGTSTLLYVQGKGSGYQFTVPADTTTRTLRIYLGAYKAKGQLQVALSDNSADPYVTTIETVTGEIARLVTLTYNAGSNNQVLTVTYTLDTGYGTTTSSPGDIDLQAATLQTITPSNTAPVANDGALTVPADTATAGTLTATDANGDPLTYSIETNGTKGTALITDASSGAYTYTPNTGESGADSFTFKTNDGEADSNIATITVTITPPPTVATPVIDPAGGSYTGSVVVSISSATNGALIYYSLDSSEPTESSTLYNGAFILDTSATLKAKGFLSGYTPSNTASADFIVTSAGNTPPVANDGALTVPADTATAGTLTATDANSDPLTYSIVTNGTKGNALITNTSTGAYTYTPNAGATGSDSFTFKANDSLADSNIATIAVTITPPPTVATPVIDPVGGSYSGSVSVSISTTTSGAMIYYTLDGSEPTPSSTLYNSPFLLTNSATLKAKGFMSGYTPSNTASAVFNITSVTAVLNGTIEVAPLIVNLTTEGTADWTHWGLGSATGFNRKSGVTPQISNITPLGAAPKQWSGPKSIWPSLTWSDGTPATSATGTSNLIYAQGIGSGYRFTVPADTTPRVLRIYLGAFKARGQLQVSLSDNSVAPYLTTIETVSGEIARLVTLTYSAGSNNQTLTVTYSLETFYGTSSSPGDVDLQAATLQVNGIGGSLIGAVDMAPSTVNLTNEGTLDWVHWGLNSATDVNRKSGVTPQISTVAFLGAAPKQWNGPKTIWSSLSWNDGVPTTSATDTSALIYAQGKGSGYRFTVPADTIPRTLKIYLGAYKAKGQLQVSLSDNSSPPYLATVETVNGEIARMITLTYRAASNNQTLMVTYSLETFYGTSSSPGDVDLQAVTLLENVSLPFSDDFSDGDMAGWTVVNQTRFASSWTVISGELYEINSIGSIADYVGTYHQGAFAYLAAGAGLTDYRFSVDAAYLATKLGEDIGVMFRYTNTNNYYRFSMNSRYGFSRLEKKVNGTFIPLATNSRGYTEGQLLQIMVDVRGDIIKIFLNGDPLFAITDTSHASGTVALYTQDLAKFDNVLISPNDIAPKIVLSTPLAHSVLTGNTIDTTAIATNVPAGGYVEFLLDGAISDVDLSAPFSTQFTGVTQGNHTVEAILRDSSGTELSRDTNTMVGSGGNYYIASGDSNTNGSADKYSTDNITQDGRIIAFHGYEANLTDLLNGSLAYPNVVANEGIGGDESVDAALPPNNRIASILVRHASSNKVLILFGTNDANSSIPHGLNCSGSSCNGTFKGNMQTLINAVNAAGKEAWVARVPPIFGSATPFANPATASINTNFVQKYNDVINTQLAGHQFGPDFYNYFLGAGVNRYSLFFDTLHPNALGNVVMAHLWHNALNPASPVSMPFILGNLTPSATAPFLKQNLIETGDTYYTDATYTITGPIPSALTNGRWIMTANTDKTSATSNYVSFTVDRPVTVYVAYDGGASNLPAWMSGFADTGLSLSVSDPLSPTLNLYMQSYTAGTITLGGNLNGAATGADSNYVAIVAAY